MKKLLPLLVFISFLSCSSDNDKENKENNLPNIIGTWVGVDVVLRADTIWFEANGNCKMYSRNYGNPIIRLYGSYKIEQNSIDITWNRKEQRWSGPIASWEEVRGFNPSATFRLTKYHPDGKEMAYSGESAYQGHSQSYFNKLE
nr:MAG TPA: protein of unknown function (DUF4969) [Caudoviricetes sp.]